MEDEYARAFAERWIFFDLNSGRHSRYNFAQIDIVVGKFFDAMP